MKLVVTGHDEQGDSVFSFAGAPPREMGPGSYDLWSTQGEIVMPDPRDGSTPAKIGYFPKVGETTWKISTVPGLDARATPPPITIHSMPEEIRAHFDPKDPEFHTTDSIDYVVVLSESGELELDHGRKEAVSAGDCMVQRGTRHAWRVTSREPLVLAAVLIGAQRR